MDEAAAALNRLYPSMSTTPSKPGGGGSVLGSSGGQQGAAPANVPTPGEALISQAREEGVSIAAASDEVLAQAVYAPDGLTNDVVNSYEPHGIYSLYEDMEKQARMINDEEQLEILSKARTATDQAFKDFSVHPVRAQQVMVAAKDYMNNPRDDATIEQMSENVINKLRSEYGRKTDGLLAGAKKVAADLCRRIPEFDQLLNAGLASDERFVRTCISVAQRKGYIR